MVLETSYDAASRVLSMVYRRGNQEVIESFTYTYDSRGNRTAKVFADGKAEKYGYDRLSRLVRAAYGDGREVHYTYDPVGNRERMIEGVAGPGAACPGDSDCDGVLDGRDNCPLIAQAAQTDSDRAAVPPNMAAGWELDEGQGTSAEDELLESAGTVVGASWVPASAAPRSPSRAPATSSCPGQRP